MARIAKHRQILAAVAAVVTGIAAQSAKASYTTINPAPKSEQTQAQILSHTYGGTFTQSGLNYTNGTVKAVRFNDAHDQSFHMHISAIRTLATFSGSTQGLAIDSNGTTTSLFNVAGKGYAATGTTGAVAWSPDERLVRTGTGLSMSSDNADNVDGKDHMVSYLLAGKGVKTPTIVCFFEDASKTQGSDFDFNDLAIEVKNCGCVTVPLPAAAWSGLATMVGGLSIAGVRKLRSQLA